MWNWFRLRTRRKAALQFVRQKLIDANMRDYLVTPSGGICHLCREETFRIVKVESKTAPSGEVFRFQTIKPLAHLCPRCECIENFRDTSGDKTHVYSWEPKEPPPAQCTGQGECGYDCPGRPHTREPSHE